MVPFLLSLRVRILRQADISMTWVLLVVLWGSPVFAGPKDKAPAVATVPELLLEGGRKLTFERSISDERDVQGKKGFWRKVLNVVAGEPGYHRLIRPYGVVSDSRGRILVSDPGAKGIHVFDFAEHKYKFLTLAEKKDPLLSPQCLTTDKQDNIYVTDSETGKLFVFRQDGKFDRVIGSLKGGEGYFKRPTGIAVDSDAQRIYVSDTLRNQIFVMDMQGSVLQRIGKSGSAAGEFNFPTEIRLEGDTLLVVDAMNFRVQGFRRDGTFLYAIGELGDTSGRMFRPKGVGIDSEGHIYIVDGYSAVVQVFDLQGRLLYYFGKKGSGFGDFQLPAGLFIDGRDEVFVADMFNRRIQEFRYFAQGSKESGVRQ